MIQPSLAVELDEASDMSLVELRKFCSKRKRRFTVSVEGNIGCGKSTLLNYFKSCPNVEPIKEPVEQWTDIDGHNGLQLLYEDPTRWSFSFNNYAMLTRLQMHLERPAVPVKLLERSLYSTRYVFIENSFRCGSLTDLEKSVLHEFFSHMLQTQDLSVDLFVYLRAPPDICYERLRSRNRQEEVSVPFEFLESLHNLHEDWLIRKAHHVPGKVLLLDASCDLPTMKKLYETRKDEILCGCA